MTRIHSLDGLRAAAIAVVVASHFTKIDAIPGGFGVTLFFAISGFIITRLILDEIDRTGGIDLLGFYKRRLFRLMPAITVSIVVAALVQQIIGRDWVTWPRALASLLFVQNYYSAGLNGFEGPLTQHWSLSVEEHFYMAFPAALLALHALGRARLVTVLFGVCLASLALRAGYQLALEPVIAENYIYRASECRIESILWGCLLAIMAHAPGYRWMGERAGRGRFWLAVAVIIGSFAIRDDLFRSTVRYSLQGGALAVIMAHILFTGRAGALRLLLNLPPVAWLGRISFSLYLLHTSALHLAAHVLPWGQHDWQTWPPALALALLMSWASYRYVEQPMIALGKRVTVRRRIRAVMAGG